MDPSSSPRVETLLAPLAINAAGGLREDLEPFLGDGMTAVRADAVGAFAHTAEGVLDGEHVSLEVDLAREQTLARVEIRGNVRGVLRRRDVLAAALRIDGELGLVERDLIREIGSEGLETFLHLYRHCVMRLPARWSPA